MNFKGHKYLFLIFDWMRNAGKFKMSDEHNENLLGLK